MLAKFLVAVLAATGFVATPQAIEAAGGENAVSIAAMDMIRHSERLQRVAYGLPVKRSQPWRRLHARRTGNHPANPRRASCR